MRRLTGAIRGNLGPVLVKLLTSDYNKEQVGKIILGGIRGYESKRKKCIKDNKPLYRTAKERGAGRLRKKLLENSSWFRGSKGGGTKKSTLVKGGKGQKEQKGGENKMKTRLVIFFGANSTWGAC